VAVINFRKTGLHAFLAFMQPLRHNSTSTPVCHSCARRAYAVDLQTCCGFHFSETDVAPRLLAADAELVSLFCCRSAESHLNAKDCFYVKIATSITVLYIGLRSPFCSIVQCTIWAYRFAFAQ